MTVKKGLTRLRVSLVTFVLLLISAGLLAASAAASGGLPANSPVFNPQETNVPYLAWRGEEVRLVKCGHELDAINTGAPTLQTNGGFFWGLDVSMQIFSYSGPQENSFDGPKAVQNSASIFFDRNTARPCIRADFISNKAGITVIKLTISKKGVILAQHDFMVGWMAIGSARMTNAGSVTENAGAQPGNSVNVQVTGLDPAEQRVPGGLWPAGHADHAERLGTVGGRDGHDRPATWEA